MASGMSRNTVIKAEGEVEAGIEPSARLRAPGGGDKSLLDTQPGLLEALDELVNPETRGNPMSHLRWTSKSSTKLADELVRQGFEVSAALGAASAAPPGLLAAGPRQGEGGPPAPRP